MFLKVKKKCIKFDQDLLELDLDSLGRNVNFKQITGLEEKTVNLKKNIGTDKTTLLFINKYFFLIKRNLDITSNQVFIKF